MLELLQFCLRLSQHYCYPFLSFEDHCVINLGITISKYPYPYALKHHQEQHPFSKFGEVPEHQRVWTTTITIALSPLPLKRNLEHQEKTCLCHPTGVINPHRQILWGLAWNKLIFFNLSAVRGNVHLASNYRE